MWRIASALQAGLEFPALAAKHAWLYGTKAIRNGRQDIIVALCGIALGGNIGDTAERFRQALSEIDGQDIAVQSVSQFFRTPPMGDAAGDEFLNAAAVAETSLRPEEVLVRLHRIEESFGRVRRVHWGPRTLDLDLLFYGDDVVDSATLVLPHPALWYRRFVLEPLCEVAADWVHPLLSESVQQLLDRLNRRPVVFQISAESGDRSVVDEIESLVRSEFASEQIRVTDAACSTAKSDDVFAHLSFVNPERPIRKQAKNNANRRIELPAAGTEERVAVARAVFAAVAG